jgi:type II secretion system protein H
MTVRCLCSASVGRLPFESGRGLPHSKNWRPFASPSKFAKRLGARTNSHLEHGFSLIELMVVLVLIGILAAMIVPEMKGTYESALLRSTGRQLIGALKLAHSQTVTLQQSHRVRLDRTAGRYIIERSGREETGGTGFFPLDDVSGGVGELDRRISVEILKSEGESMEGGASDIVRGSEDEFSAGKPVEVISFYPDGTVDAVEIVLRDREGFGLALRLNPVTARMRTIELDRR